MRSHQRKQMEIVVETLEKNFVEFVILVNLWHIVWLTH